MSTFDEFSHWLASKIGYWVESRIELYEVFELFASQGKDAKTSIEKRLERLEQRNDIQRHVVRRWHTGLLDGKTMSEVLQPYLPASEIMMIRAGEDLADTAKGYQQAIMVAQTAQALRGAMLQAMIEPVLLFLGMFSLMFLLALHVLPTFVDVLPPERWPGYAQVLNDVAGFVRDWGLILLGLLIALGILVIKTIPTWHTGPRHFLDRRLPPWMIYRRTQAAIVLFAIHALMNAGKPITDALETMASISKNWLTWHLQLAKRRLDNGDEYAASLDTGLFDQSTIDLLEDFESAGPFQKALDAVASRITHFTLKRLARNVKFLRYSFIGCIGILIVWVWLSMIGITMAIQAAAKSVQGF